MIWLWMASYIAVGVMLCLVIEGVLYLVADDLETYEELSLFEFEGAGAWIYAASLIWPVIVVQGVRWFVVARRAVRDARRATA